MEEDSDATASDIEQEPPVEPKNPLETRIPVLLMTDDKYDTRKEYDEDKHYVNTKVAEYAKHMLLLYPNARMYILDDVTENTCKYFHRVGIPKWLIYAPNYNMLSAMWLGAQSELAYWYAMWWNEFIVYQSKPPLNRPEVSLVWFDAMNTLRMMKEDIDSIFQHTNFVDGAYLVLTVNKRDNKQRKLTAIEEKICARYATKDGYVILSVTINTIAKKYGYKLHCLWDHTYAMYAVAWRVTKL